MSQFYTETHDRGMKDLSESVASGNLGLPWLDPCVFSPRQSWLAGAGAPVRPSSPKRLRRSVHVPCEPKRTEKTRNSTSRLGVSRRQALSTLTPARRRGPFRNKFRQDSALDCRSTFKLQPKALQLQGPLHNPSGCIWVVQDPLQQEASDDGDLMCLEIVTQLS